MLFNNSIVGHEDLFFSFFNGFITNVGPGPESMKFQTDILYHLSETISTIQIFSKKRINYTNRNTSKRLLNFYLYINKELRTKVNTSITVGQLVEENCYLATYGLTTRILNRLKCL